MQSIKLLVFMKALSSAEKFYEAGYTKTAFEAYPSPSETYCWHKMKASLLKFIKEELEKKKGTSLNVLDLGCGNGRDIFNFSVMCGGKLNFFGIDISSTAISRAKKVADDSGFKNMDFFVGDVVNKETWPQKLKDMKFDIVISSEVLEHLENPERFIKTISSSLVSGGCLILSSPNKTYFLKELYKKLPKKFQEKYVDVNDKRFGMVEFDVGHISVCSYREISSMVKNNGLIMERGMRGAPFYGGTNIDRSRPLVCLYVLTDMILPNKPYFGWEFVIKARKQN